MPNTPNGPHHGTDRSRTDLANQPCYSLVPTRVAWDWTGISAQKLHKLISSGAIETVKIKKELYVLLDSLERVLREESDHE